VTIEGQDSSSMSWAAVSPSLRLTMIRIRVVDRRTNVVGLDPDRLDAGLSQALHEQRAAVQSHVDNFDNLARVLFDRSSTIQKLQ
jgi:hypothetical protein